ncbi:phosphoglycerate mutase [Magnetococcus marinus MC-1]|uniref:Phosphoglycerate mutase n=1 Tax=Magnetococcus marinus (strain ATCC BAA-1437 / JCM 17883 / MC-1) TaxID=156889 RepID=A0L5U0_MAGMM|nr:cofactor-independent phosphoglycerate mutase [Magnetococcus marinus]ABK43333.1 phosphoglycerate mutase [Magnetococcus marinus MC-1]
MKYVVFLGDGMSDNPVDALDGRTPLMVANTPNLDSMVKDGVGGWCRNTPDGFEPGSDVANLGVLGYDVRESYSGRSPLEAAAMGVTLNAGDVAFRCNLVSLSQDYGVMADFSAGHITSAEAAQLIHALQTQLGSEAFEFHAGVSYRHLLVWRGGRVDLRCRAPHDISDQAIAGHLPTGPDAEPIVGLMMASRAVLGDHPVNQQRVAEGKLPANSIWLWGHGYRPQLTHFKKRFGKSGAMITAVDLMRGIANCIDFENMVVPGATGWIDTDYAGKAAACVEALQRHDLVFVHVESPDESGHAGRLDYKIKAIEDFDAKVVGPVLAYLRGQGAYRAVALPDHPTPVETKTHNMNPVPFAMCGTGIEPDDNARYDENLLERGSVAYDPGIRMMPALLGGQ